MNKIKLTAVLMLTLFMSASSFAKPAPNGVNNYVANGHLYVWYNDHYVDMGAYVLGPPCVGCPK
jgi:hypothetical protein